MLVQIKYNEQQKYVKLDRIEGRFDLQFHLKVIEKFCLPPDASITYNDATGTEVDAEIFSDLIGQGNVVLTVFSNDEFSDSLPSISEMSDTSNSSGASTIILDEVPNKRQRKENAFFTWEAQVKNSLACHPPIPKTPSRILLKAVQAELDG